MESALPQFLVFSEPFSSSIGSMGTAQCKLRRALEARGMVLIWALGFVLVQSSYAQTVEQYRQRAIESSRAKSWDDAIRKANDSEYGLQAGVFTRDASRMMQAWHELEVGGVVGNDIPTLRLDHLPYGGVKSSGFGREGLREAMREMTEERLLLWKA